MSEIISIREFARRVGVSDTAIHKHIQAGRISKALTVKGKRPALLADVAIDEYEAAGGGYHSADYIGGKRSNRQPESSPPISPPSFSTEAAEPRQERQQPSPQESATLAAAKRAKAVYDAKLAELEFKKRNGTLVPKKEVYEQLFGFGRELRTNLMAIPDRVVDEMLAAPTRADAYNMLYDALATTLDRMSKLQPDDIAPER